TPEPVTTQSGGGAGARASCVLTGTGHGPAGDPGVDEITEGRTDGFGFDEEGVVTVVRVHDVMGDSRARSTESLRERFGLLGRKMPVAGKTQYERFDVEHRACVGIRTVHHGEDV